MSGEAPSKDAVPSSFFLGKVNTAPFVPSPKLAGDNNAKGSTGNLSSAIKAAPFVPGGNSGGGKQRNDAAHAGGSSMRPNSPAPPLDNAGPSPGRWWKGGRGDDFQGGGGGGRGRGRVGRGGSGGSSNLGSHNQQQQQQQHQQQHAAGSMGSIFNQFGGHSGSAPGVSVIPQYRPHEQYIMGSGRQQLTGQFMSDSIKHQLQERSYIIQSQWQTPSEESSGFPDKVQQYHSLYPLDDDPKAGVNAEVSASLGLRTTVFKGISSIDGQAYALRRIDGKQVIPSSDLVSQSRQQVEAWSAVANHPNLVGLRAVFVSSEIESHASIFFVHDFHAGAVTLMNAHMVPRMSASGVVALSPPTEDQMWSYLVQLASALRSVHSAGLSLGQSSLHPSKVLLTGFGRLRVGSVGMEQSLSGERDERDDVHMLHRQDLTAVGQLLLNLACAGMSTVPSLDACASHFSMDLTRVLAALCASAEGGALATWRQLAGAVADRSLAEMDAVSVTNDNVISELSKECENGRLFRLMTKLGFVNDRPELRGDPQWSETGDRYLLKLFRDYLFHQYSPEDGSPLVDWGHVVEALNKLDAGVTEKVLLMSRDEASMLVVSYSDLKKCLLTAYQEVKSSQ